MAWIDVLYIWASFWIQSSNAAHADSIYRDIMSLTQSHIDSRFDLLCKQCSHEHGECLLGRCICVPGWSGDSCLEPWSTDIPPCKPLNCYKSGEDDTDYCFGDPDDSCHYHPEYGVLRVTKDRWMHAQQRELSLWMGLHDDDNDRSPYHEGHFNNYNSIRRVHLGHVLEVASGPFTQIAHIMQTADNTVNSITLLDPLIIKYITSVNKCAYKNGTLRGIDVSLLVTGAEKLRGRGQFDTVVMINGLEHVQDAVQVLRNVYDALAPGGLFIFHEAYYNKYRGIPAQPVTPYNLLDFMFHPIRIKQAFFEWYLRDFEPLYIHYVDEKDELYFIGRKPIHDSGWRALLGSLAAAGQTSVDL
jgi:SAM-dependent methyltransferase